MSNKRRLWTRDELILAFNLYLKIPFGKINRTNRDIIKLSNLINRTPSSVSMRLSNFASVDPYHQSRGISGLKGGISVVQPIWDEFFKNQEELIFLSEQILAERENTTIDSKFENLLISTKNLKGKTKLKEVKTRVNQSFFRQIVLTNYSKRCAITGIDIPEFLVASHIIPWSVNKKERLNPENGICLSPLYDKAFDRGFIGIKPDYSIILSSKLKAKSTQDYFQKYFAPLENIKLAEPTKYLAKKEFLEYHLDEIYLK